MTNDTLYWESQVAERLGVSRSHLRALRKEHLTQGADWTLRENAVVLTDIGLQKVVARLEGATSTLAGEQNPATLPSAPAAVIPGPPPKAQYMVVRKPLNRTDRPQTKILICRGCEAKQPEVKSWEIAKADLHKVERPIRVRDNTNFLPGMVLEAVCIGHGMWQYLGRLPRRPGRW